MANRRSSPKVGGLFDFEIVSFQGPPISIQDNFLSVIWTVHFHPRPSQGSSDRWSCEEVALNV